ncbi:hypothetical protein Vretifemale_750, partial [Volvox reticuliferus]
QIVDCGWGFGLNACYGGSYTASIAYVVAAGGIAEEGEYPYIGEVGCCDGPIASQSSNVTYFRNNMAAAVPLYNAFTGVIAVESGNIPAMMQALAQKGPLMVSIYAGNPYFQFYGG